MDLTLDPTIDQTTEEPETTEDATTAELPEVTEETEG